MIVSKWLAKIGIYDVRCTMYDVRCTMYDVLCTMYAVRNLITAHESRLTAHVTRDPRHVPRDIFFVLSASEIYLKDETTSAYVIVALYPGAAGTGCKRDPDEIPECR